MRIYRNNIIIRVQYNKGDDLLVRIKLSSINEKNIQFFKIIVSLNLSLWQHQADTLSISKTLLVYSTHKGTRRIYKV